ncbi:U-box domain-containing protein [Striga asiatica]|uniref:RING-type E3 ubiquitin transferase n=1 Tax=Striga asiatica TaxID=4170 RepID=A0A5A7RFJ5_STRAF|nr:U-box domain-containing protein [Striga asiatica]
MINKPTESCSRRILNFPATCPGESVSFHTLLTSLIGLSRSICSFTSKPIFTNRKNARTSIRIVQNLLLFFEDIRQDKKDPTFTESSVLLSLSELHFTLQKLDFLLQDCSRENSRLWMLMQSEKVSFHFHNLVRNIAVALDVLPLSALEIPDEGRELAELVRHRARIAGFEVEDEDKRAASRVLQSIGYFESGVAPESNYLKRVLDYLGIGTWAECDNEIRLLESLTGPEFGGKKDEARFICDLIAFLICCRCIAFENNLGGFSESSVAARRFDFRVTGFSNLDDFTCPISLEIMGDPVTISTGHTYDRKSIAKWLNSGNRTCPKTGERLVSAELVPNLAVKRLIAQWCQENGLPFPGGRFRNSAKPLDFASGSPAAERAAGIVARFLAGKLRDEKSRGKACREIRLLTKTSVFCRSRLVESDAIPGLLDSTHHEENQENAAAALLNLSKLVEGKRAIVENRGVEKIIDLLNRGAKMETRAHAAGVLFYLSSDERCREMINRNSGSVVGLVGLIRARSGRWRRNGLAAALGLLAGPESHRRFLSAGLGLTLVNVLTEASGKEDDVADLLSVLAVLAEKPEGAEAIISAGGLPVIIKILGSCGDFCVSRSAKECCVSVLLALCTKGGSDVVPVLVRDSSVMTGLYSVLAGGSCGPSRKAGLLIGILHAFGETRRSGSGSGSSIGPGFGPEQFVHVW